MNPMTKGGPEASVGTVNHAEPTSTETPSPRAAPLRYRTERRGIKPRGFGRVYQRGAVYWVEYWHHGRQFRESSQSVRQVDAERLLKRRLQQIGRGRFVGPSEERVLFT